MFTGSFSIFVLFPHPDPFISGNFPGLLYFFQEFARILGLEPSIQIEFSFLFSFWSWGKLLSFFSHGLFHESLRPRVIPLEAPPFGWFDLIFISVEITFQVWGNSSFLLIFELKGNPSFLRFFAAFLPRVIQSALEIFDIIRSSYLQVSLTCIFLWFFLKEFQDLFWGEVSLFLWSSGFINS